MYCPRCGRSYGEAVNFCSACGASMFPNPMAGKKLQLSRKDCKIAGVCGGFAEYLEVDPTLVRVVWLMTALFIGWGFLAYFIAWIVMPNEPIGAEVNAAKAPANPQTAIHV